MKPKEKFNYLERIKTDSISDLYITTATCSVTNSKGTFKDRPSVIICDTDNISVNIILTWQQAKSMAEKLTRFADKLKDKEKETKEPPDK